MKVLADTIYLVSSISGAILVALNIGLQLEGYIVFLISSVAGIYLLLQSNASRSLVVVAVIFMVVNIVGILRA